MIYVEAGSSLSFQKQYQYIAPIILTAAIRIKSTYNVNMIVIMFVGKVYSLLSGMDMGHSCFILF